MPRKVISDVVREHDGSAKSKMLDDKEKRPHFLSRERFRNRTDLGSVKKRSSKGRGFIWIIVLVVVVIAFFVLSAVFSSATIKVTPRQESVAVEATITVHRNPDSADELSFQTIEWPGEVSKLVSSSGTKYVERKASGKITVFNNFSTSAQRLVTNTRFQSPEGNIYRVQSAISIPGYETIDGVKVPGELEVTVVADEPGSEYNIGPSNFTVPGLKGDERYDEIYARSSASISGGAIGEIPVIEDSDRADAEQKLISELDQKLFNEIDMQVPEGYVLITDASQVLYSVLSDGSEGEMEGEQVQLTQEGTLHAFVLNKSSLSRFLAERTISDYGKEDIIIDNIENLVFTVTEDQKNNVISSENVTISVSGNAIFVWQFNEEELATNLAGQKKSSYQTVFATHPTIERAEAILRPPWKRKFPTNTEKIRVETLVGGNNQ